MITSATWKELPNFVAIGSAEVRLRRPHDENCHVAIGSAEVAPHVGEIYSSSWFAVFLKTFFFLFLFLFRQIAYRPQFATDFDV